jgi:glyoxalase family protein
MQLNGIHHLTAISARPRDNLSFYAGLPGMRLVKKTVNRPMPAPVSPSSTAARDS